MLHHSRLKLCKRKGYDKFSNLQRPSWTEHSRPTSPQRYSYPSLLTATQHSTLSPMCKWWKVYVEAHTLQRNWIVGVYTMAPLLRGHSQRVTCIAHEGILVYIMIVLSSTVL